MHIKYEMEESYIVSMTTNESKSARMCAAKFLLITKLQINRWSLRYLYTVILTLNCYPLLSFFFKSFKSHLGLAIIHILKSSKYMHSAQQAEKQPPHKIISMRKKTANELRNVHF